MRVDKGVFEPLSFLPTFFSLLLLFFSSPAADIQEAPFHERRINMTPSTTPTGAVETTVWLQGRRRRMSLCHSGRQRRGATMTEPIYPAVSGVLYEFQLARGSPPRRSLGVHGNGRCFPSSDMESVRRVKEVLSAFYTQCTLSLSHFFLVIIIGSKLTLFTSHDDIYSDQSRMQATIGNEGPSMHVFGPRW